MKTFDFLKERVVFLLVNLVLALAVIIFLYYIGIYTYLLLFILCLWFLPMLSLSSFVMRILQFNDKIYFKNLNMFIVRQINSKINTNYISIALICLMLFLSIEVLSSGLALNNSLSKSIKFDTPYDATILGEKNTKSSIIEELQKSNININNFTDSYLEYKTYDTKLSYHSILVPNAIEKANKNKKIQGILNDSIEAMKLTDFNKLMLLQGKNPIKLSDDQYAIIFNTESTKGLYTNLIKINLNGNQLKPKYDKGIYVNTETGYNPYNYGTIVVEDKIVDNLQVVPFSQKLCIQYKSAEKELISKKINTLFKNTSKSGEFSQYSKVDTYVLEQGNSISFAFIGIYLGLIFLITSVAILSLQQLCECADSIERYKILRKIGVEEGTINKSIFIQIAIYFFTPLSLAIIHSIAGLKLANDMILRSGATNIIGYIIFTAICICIIYGGYFLATYIGAKNIIKNSN
jgi:putative ABC transport system permease protein